MPLPLEQRLEIERTNLIRALIYPEYIGSFTAILTARDFTKGLHRDTFNAIVNGTVDKEAALAALRAESPEPIR